jgi:hypothetical protein
MTVGNSYMHFPPAHITLSVSASPYVWVGATLSHDNVALWPIQVAKSAHVSTPGESTWIAARLLYQRKHSTDEWLARDCGQQFGLATVSSRDYPLEDK